MRLETGKLAELLRAAVEPLGYELVGVEYLPQGRHSLLRVYVDHADGITVEDCQRVSHQVSGVLDVEDPIPGQYSLEVSSPGMDRPLFTREHFERFAGQRVKLTLGMALQGRKRFDGLLRGLREDQVVIELEEGEVAIPFDRIEKARLVPEF